MNKLKKSITSLIILGSLGFAANISAKTDVPPPQLNNLITSGVVKVVETFKHDSLTGWLVENDGEYNLYWATEDNYVIAGPLIDQSGENLTTKYLETKKPVPNYDEEFSLLTNDATVIRTHPEKAVNGSKGALYVFVEPFCGWCAKLEKELEPAIAAGLDVRYVPVAFLRGNSPDVIENMLSSDDPAAAMAEHQRLREMRMPALTKTATLQTRAALEQNSEFMRRFGISGTPGLVYQVDGQVKVGGYMKATQLNRLVKTLMTQK